MYSLLNLSALLCLGLPSYACVHTLTPVSTLLRLYPPPKCPTPLLALLPLCLPLTPVSALLRLGPPSYASVRPPTPVSALVHLCLPSYAWVYPPTPAFTLLRLCPLLSLCLPTPGVQKRPFPKTTFALIFQSHSIIFSH